MPLTGVELPRRREVSRPLRVLRLLRRPLVLLGRGDLEGVLQDPLLHRQQLPPPQPLRTHPPFKVLALNDDAARGLREGAAGLDVVLDGGEGHQSGLLPTQGCLRGGQRRLLPTCGSSAPLSPVLP